MQYLLTKDGKIVEIPSQIKNWTQRTDAQNNALKSAGITGVNFKTSKWSDQLKEQGIKLFDDKNQASIESLRIEQQKSADAIKSDYEKRLADIAGQENAKNALAQQIAAISGGNQPGTTIGAVAPTIPAGLSASALDAISGGISQLALAQNPAITALSAQRNYATSDLANKLNFQVSDQQILDDYNNAKLGRLNRIVQQGNAQVAGIQQRLTAAQSLLDQLPKNDPRYTSSKVYVDQLNADLKSVTDAITGANQQIKDFKPISVGSPEAASEITSFREYLKLPEENATQQLRQIDPESYKTAVALGQRYRQMATQPIGQTVSPQTEQLRSQLEQEAINQLQLGSQLGAEEQRQYQQAARAAQTARGNIFGVAPAVEEAVTTGAAGEQRKLARYGAAAQFLTSGETTGAALQRDIAFRDALLQNRLGAASGFIAGGPTLANLAQARTSQQQAAFQNYIQANQALPGQFGQAPSTAQPFYQAVDQGIPVNLTNTFANLYGSMADYQARTYGAYTQAQASRPTFAQQFGQIATGVGNLFSPFKFG